jgi:predicted acetyltransferase
MADIRPPEEADREAIASVSGLAFNSPVRPERVSLAGTLCMYDGPRLIGTARSIGFDQWFGGARVACSGIAGVAVQPEDRGHGVAGSLVGELLRQERADGRLVSALYPSTTALYRRLGYEFGGARPHFRVALTDLQASPATVTATPRNEGRELVVRPMEEGELGAVMQCFSRFASVHNGPVEATDPPYWEDRVLAHNGEGTHQRTMVVAGDGGLEGYASYYTEERSAAGYAVACKHLVVTSAAALGALLRHFRGFENAAKELTWVGPVNAGPFGLALRTNGFSLVAGLRRWMARVLDVPKALEARGYPNVEGEAVLAIDDPLFPDNAGPWVVQATAGKVTVRPLGRETGGGVTALPIGLFSALYTGFATPSDLVLLDALDDDDARIGFLSALFAGPVPWMADSF